MRQHTYRVFPILALALALFGCSGMPLQPSKTMKPSVGGDYLISIDTEVASLKILNMPTV